MKLKNTLARSYNGIKGFGTVEVTDKAYIKTLLANGFVDVNKVAKAEDPEDTEDPPENPPAEKSLAKMNKEELRAKAAELGIDIADDLSNAQIINLIKASTEKK